MTSLNPRNRLPLDLTIAGLFTVLVIVLGVVLSWLNYSKTSDIILSSADTVAAQIMQEMTLDFKASYRPVASALDLLALSPLTRAKDLDERLKSLRMLMTAMHDVPSMAAIQVGYGDGDYFIVRGLGSAHMRARFEAPDGAAIVVDNVDAQGGARLTRLYFDADLREMARLAPVPSRYDPRTRGWYRDAGASEPLATRPYLFYFMDKVGTTVTLKTPQPDVVIAADITLEQLSRTLARHRITPSSEAVLMGGDGSALAYRDPQRLIQASGEDGFRIARLHELGSAVLTHLSPDLEARPQELEFRFGGQPWTGSVRKLAKQLGGLGLYLLMVSPVHELLSEASEMRRLSLVITLLVFLIAMPVIWLVARRISGPLRRLAGEAGVIGRFDFAGPIETRSLIKEVDELAGAMDMMKTTISRFLALINSLAGEKDFDPLLERITRETMLVGQADAVLTYLVDEDERHLVPASLQGRERGPMDIDPLPRLPLDADHALVQAAKQQGTRLIRLDRTDTLAPLLATIRTTELSLVTLPLRNRQEALIGVLCLIYHETVAGRELRGQEAHIAFVQALSGFAAVSLESRHLLMMQEALLDAFIKLIAGAIDAKSPYTGGHCQRVPELTRMLAQAACESDAPPFRDFRLDPEQWEALEIASWLHDCGKVTTPEYVVDKATKLETLYDRIHEIRMRFEVLKRDAEIRHWRALAEGGEREALSKELEAAWRELDQDFAFVAECNLGGEFMAPERIERLERIAARTWMRTLDDRMGISWEERRRKDRVPASPLPVRERLLDDRPEHLIERDESERIPEDNPWGFRLDVPRHKYNRGELYNLRIARGTLSAEERYKINDHIVQTIIMLERLPYPRHLRQVPLIAGCHHETLDGKGYPRRLTRDQMPLTARMMAIADIFEALTASDRPYKKAKTLSEAVRIMDLMRRDHHIDPELFELFLSSGVWLEYAQRFLRPEQIDEVDINEYRED